MTKFPRFISKKDQENLFIEFAQGLASLHSVEEVAHFIKDLLSEQETVMLARRLQIAKLLHEGSTYDQIRQALKVGTSTIARVQTWMQLYGEGYRTVLERTKKKETVNKPSSWRQLQRRYPTYFWPQLLLSEIVKSANARQKKRLLSVLDSLKEKTHVSKELEILLKPARK